MKSMAFANYRSAWFQTYTHHSSQKGELLIKLSDGMVVEASAKANTSNMIQYVLHHQCKLLPSPSPPASATCLPKCLFNALNCNAQQLRQRTVLFSHRIYPPRLRRLWWLRRLGRLRGLCRGRSCTPFLVLHRAGWIPGEEGMIKVPPPSSLGVKRVTTCHQLERSSQIQDWCLMTLRPFKSHGLSSSMWLALLWLSSCPAATIGRAKK